MTQIRIQTAQNVAINYSIASLGDRIAGALIDAVIKFVYIIAVAMLFGLLAGTISGFKSWYILIPFFIPVLFYTLLCETFLNGQTFGKKAMNTKVIRLDGIEANFGNYLVRWLFKLIDEQMFYIGLIIIAVSDKGQRIGDIVAGTTVIKLSKPLTYYDTLDETFDENYKIVFSQVYNLTDKDIAIIKNALYKNLESANYDVINDLANKTKDVLGIETKMPPVAFLKTIIKDYAHIEEKAFH